MQLGAPVLWEPVVTTVLLPRCPRCQSPHPLACQPVPADTTACPRCGGPAAAAGAPITTRAVATGLAGGLLAIGRFFAWLYRRLS